jgi:hypothetical protein
MEDLAWTREKREGGGDIIDLLIRACFIQGLCEDRIKMMVKAKGSVNTPMAQLVEIALEEESAIRSERFRKNPVERERFRSQGRRYVPQGHNEPTEVQIGTIRCRRCNRLGHLSHQCKALLLSGREAGEKVGSVAKIHDCRNTVAKNGQRGCLGNRR